MKYEIIYENDKIVFVVKHQENILIKTAKYFRQQTLGE